MYMKIYGNISWMYNNTISYIHPPLPILYISRATLYFYKCPFVRHVFVGNMVSQLKYESIIFIETLQIFSGMCVLS